VFRVEPCCDTHLAMTPPPLWVAEPGEYLLFVLCSRGNDHCRIERTREKVRAPVVQDRKDSSILMNAGQGIRHVNMPKQRLRTLQFSWCSSRGRARTKGTTRCNWERYVHPSRVLARSVAEAMHGRRMGGLTEETDRTTRTQRRHRPINIHDILDCRAEPAKPRLGTVDAVTSSVVFGDRRQLRQACRLTAMGQRSATYPQDQASRPQRVDMGRSAKEKTVADCFAR
jgi:hypothetical protein